jgi:uncharacterized protein YjbI with pentapeptide repeats
MESYNSSEDESTPATPSRKSCSRLRIRILLRLISNIIIPLIIGIFTIIIAVQQQNVAQTNRDKDIAQAAKLRSEDLERARLQRQEDNELARLQREEDKKNARSQREEEKEIGRLQREKDREIARLQRADDQETARLQRELDLNLAKDKRIQEYELAEKQRSLYENQRIHEFGITQQNYMKDLILEDDRQKEKILVHYQRELAKLISNSNLIFNASYSKLRIILQMRTKAALRQLNSARRTIVVHTLFQADLFSESLREEKSPLYRTNVSGVQFGLPSGLIFSNYLMIYNYLDIEHADIRHASFRFVSFKNAPSFKYSNLDYTDWSFAQLSFITFKNKLTINDAIFHKTYFKYINFQNIPMNRVSFENNIRCDYCIFNGTSLSGARLFNSSFYYSIFISVSMADVNMSYSYFFDTSFQNVTLDRVDISNIVFDYGAFNQVSMINCTMHGAMFRSTSRLDVNKRGCQGKEIMDYPSYE